jgi:coproporphyrinogen III oxidase
MTPLRTRSSDYFTQLQASLCEAFERADGAARFSTDRWQRQEEGAQEKSQYGGGGLTRVLRNGAVFEQAGVNFSAVEGTLSAEMCTRLGVGSTALPFFATGVSLVLHPYSPLVPTTHANVRYLEVGQHAWFGGGSDLTPYYLFEEDATHFHQQLKASCDRHATDYYPRFKKECDQYFFLPHRGEGRGIGGIFFDYLGRHAPQELEAHFEFVQSVGNCLGQCYLPIVERRKGLAFTEAQKQFQLLRRGRYVEFNLLYDRGTLFGLKTGGRIESILMSLPPLVRWEYETEIVPGSAEEKLLAVLRQPREWV